MNGNNRTIVKNFFYNILFEVVALLVPLVTAPFLVRKLGSDNMGIYTVVNSTMNVISQLSLLGLNIYGKRQIAYCQSDKKKRTEAFWDIFWLRTLLSIFGTIIYFGIALNSEYRIFFLINYIYLFAVFFDLSWFFIGIEDMKPMVLKNIFARLVSASLIFATIRDKNDLIFYFLSVSISIFMANLSLVKQLGKYVGKPCKLSSERFKGHIVSSVLLFVPQIASTIYLQVDKLMIESVTGFASQVSYYDQAEKMIMIPLSVLTAFSTVMMPRLASLYGERKNEKMRGLLIQSGRISLLISVPMTIGMVLISKNLVLWYLGKEYTPAATAMIVLSPLIVINSLIYITERQYYIATNKMKYVIIANFTAAIVNVLLNIFLMQKLEFIGAAYATVICMLVSLIIQFWGAKSDFDLFDVLKKSWKIIVSGLAMGFFVLFVTCKMEFISGWILTVVQVLCGIGIYTLMLFVLREEYLSICIKTIKDRIVVIRH